MSKKKKRTDLANWVVHPAPDSKFAEVLQRMPDARFRINPEHRDEIAAWLFARSREWYRQSVAVLIGLRGESRQRQLHAIRNAKAKLAGVEYLIEQLQNTVSAADIEHAMRCIHEGTVITQLHIPGTMDGDDGPEPPKAA